MNTSDLNHLHPAYWLAVFSMGIYHQSQTKISTHNFSSETDGTEINDQKRLFSVKGLTNRSGYLFSVCFRIQTEICTQSMLFSIWDVYR